MNIHVILIFLLLQSYIGYLKDNITYAIIGVNMHIDLFINKAINIEILNLKLN